MQLVNRLLDLFRLGIRAVMRRVAGLLNQLSGGRLSPNTVTAVSLLGHLPVAGLIAVQEFRWAAVLLVIFGLMDTLDGELARLQKRASPAGMLLDASTDRMKEAFLYIASAYVFVEIGRPHIAAWAVAACAGSMLVSYIKAKGETAVASKGSDHAQVNYLFADGLMRYEVRMFALVVGLVSGKLVEAVLILAVLTWLTACGRLIRIIRYLQHV